MVVGVADRIPLGSSLYPVGREVDAGVWKMDYLNGQVSEICISSETSF